MCKIPDQKNENENIIVLITCYHVIKIIQKENGKYYYKDDDSKEIESISIKYHYKKEDYNSKLDLRNRRIWYDEEIDYIFFEIKKEEYELEEKYLYSFESKIIPNKGDNISIYIYMTQVKTINANYSCKCLDKEYKISYNISDETNTTSEGCSGSPVVYKNSIIAIHSERDGKNDIRKGSLLEYIITHLNEPHICEKENLRIEKEYKIKALVDVNSYDSQSGDFILTKKEFNEIFREQVRLYLLKCDDPDKVCDMIETYAIGHYSDVTTMEQYIKETQSEAAQLYTIMGVIIAVAVGMTFIGMVSNQLIGFEGRKKECAIMLATSMGKGKLSGILFLEVLMTSFVASVMGTLSGIFFANVIGDAAGNSYILLEIKVDPLKCLLFGVLLIVVFAGTVLFPIKNLRKMKISEQLKYE